MSVKAVGLVQHPDQDIAVMRLAKPIMLIKGKIEALHLAGKKAPMEPKSCMAVGWGRN